MGSRLLGTVAVVVGDFTDVSFGVALQLARAGATSLHLVGPSEARLTEVAEQLSAECDGCEVVRHDVNFLHPGDVVQWCRAACDLLSQLGQQVNIMVLSSVAVVPKEQRFTVDALEQAFAADVVGLQALLNGLRPVLSPGARVLVTASATCNWLSRPSHKALCHGSSADSLPVLLARSQQQAARVVVACRQARLWAAESDGPICASCTPTGCWSAWTDLLAWAGLLDSLKTWTRESNPATHAALTAQIIAAVREQVAGARAAITTQIASAVVHLCCRSSFVAPGDYYWARSRVGGFGSSCCMNGLHDADIEKMFLGLALSSGQLPN
jgi:NAD(P)-dependent dehydrogenase (short-subunit alcohol dehydrogenase family)